MASSKLQVWKAARQHPTVYPGDCPDHAYVIVGDDVHPLVFKTPGDLSSAVAIIKRRELPLDPLLDARGVPRLADRYPSLAYGANRNPGTLAIKMHHYAYEHGTEELILPVLKGTTRGADVVACGLSGQGYLYADLLPTPVGADDVAIEAWLPLLDLDQLRVMHDGENVREGLYSVAQFPFFVDGFRSEVRALGYAGNDAAFVSPALGQPLTYSTVQVSHRTFPSMTPAEMMAHVIDVGEVASTLSTLVGVRAGERLAPATMQFMNERWWRRFRGEDQPDGRYVDVMMLLNAVIETSQARQSVAAVLKERGLTLSVEEAYAPESCLRLGAMMALARLSRASGGGPHGIGNHDPRVANAQKKKV